MLFRLTKKVLILQTMYGVGLLVLFLLLLYLDAPSNLETWLYMLGKYFAFAGITMLSIQFLLSARILLLEKGIGHDRIMRWHKRNAQMATVLLLIHPVLVFYRPLLRAGVSFQQLIQGLTPSLIMGEIALGLIILTVIVSIYGYKIKLSYEVWGLLHKAVYAIIILGFVHSFFVGSDVMSRGLLFYWWLGLLAMVLFAAFYRLIWRRIKLRNSIYTVTKIKQETMTVRTFNLKPQDQEPFDYVPGQFAFMRVNANGVSREEHHFTLSSSPRDGELSFTIKELGDFTSSLKKVKVGDSIKIEGPFGAFTNQGMSGPFVFVAGGIGITPVRSMLRTMYLDKRNEKTLLLYANRSPEDVVFKNELEAIAKEGWLRLVHIYSDAEIEGAHHGYVSAEIAEKELKTSGILPSEATYFVVGPPPMMNAAQKILLELGADKKKIFSERFALR